MPNWCWNNIHIDGPPEDLERFTEMVQGADDNGNKSLFDFRRIVPAPPEAHDRDVTVNAEGPLPAGYSWAINNWGTKWNAGEVEMDAGDGWAIYTFDTAWEPPLKVIKHASKLFPTLEFQIEYSEPGNGVIGMERFKSGEEID